MLKASGFNWQVHKRNALKTLLKTKSKHPLKKYILAGLKKNLSNSTDHQGSLFGFWVGK